jgi:DDE superfamily endonuclease
MEQLTPSLHSLLLPLAPCFRPEVFATFCSMAAAWIVCLGRRTISRVWETTGRSATHSHCPAFRLFSAAVWNWDEVVRLSLAQLLTLVPGTKLWLVVDDTLCHKRGAKVAFGGIFLDAVLSTRKHKTLRFGVNWVTLGLVIQLPCRQDRCFCVNILWRVCQKAKGKKDKEHRTKSQRARAMVDLLVDWLPGYQFVIVADSAYVGKHLLKGLPAHVAVVGPIHWKAGLTAPLEPDAPRRWKKGEEMPNPTEWFETTDWPWEDLLLRHPKGEKALQVKVVRGACWYSVAGSRPLQVVLVRDPAGQWRDEALLSTDLGLSAQEVILGYARRWSVEVAYCDSKQLLGLHDPQVWCVNSVERAHPMAWFVGGAVLLWYARNGHQETAARRQRPWYQQKVEPTFADMLACARLHLWHNWLESDAATREDKLAWLLDYLATAA